MRCASCGAIIGGESEPVPVIPSDPGLVPYPDEETARTLYHRAIGLAYHRLVGGGPAAEAPTTDVVWSTLQTLINQVAEGGLVARRMLDVEYTDDVLPHTPPGLTPDPQTRDTGIVQCYTAAPAEAGHYATAEFSLDAPTIQAVERAPKRANLKNLIDAVRALVRWENATVLADLAAAAQPIERGEDAETGLDRCLLALRSRGYAGDAVAIAVARPLAAPDAAAPKPGKSAAAPSRLSLTPALVLFAEHPGGEATFDVLAMEAGGHNARLVVGQNYALRWLRHDGATHAFAIALSFQVLVTDPAAIVKA